MAKQITVHTRLDAKTFRRFCAFDTFRRQRRWYVPVLVSMVLITLSLAGLLGRLPISESSSGVAMGLGIAVPLVVFGLYFIQIEAQVASQGLKSAPAVYSLALRAEGIEVTNDQKKEAPVELDWTQLWGAFRRPDAVYLYVNPQRAFILPDGQASASPDELWRFVQKCLGPEKCISRR